MYSFTDLEPFHFHRFRKAHGTALLYRKSIKELNEVDRVHSKHYQSPKCPWYQNGGVNTSCTHLCMLYRGQYQLNEWQLNLQFPRLARKDPSHCDITITEYIFSQMYFYFMTLSSKEAIFGLINFILFCFFNLLIRVLPLFFRNIHSSKP